MKFVFLFLFVSCVHGVGLCVCVAPHWVDRGMSLEWKCEAFGGEMEGRTAYQAEVSPPPPPFAASFLVQTENNVRHWRCQLETTDNRKANRAFLFLNAVFSTPILFCFFLAC